MVFSSAPADVSPHLPPVSGVSGATIFQSPGIEALSPQGRITPAHSEVGPERCRTSVGGLAATHPSRLPSYYRPRAFQTGDNSQCPQERDKILLLLQL